MKVLLKMLFLFFILNSCDFKHAKIYKSEVNDLKESNQSTEVKKQEVNLNNQLYGDLEFGMTKEMVLNSQIFKGGNIDSSDKSNFLLWSKSILKDKLEEISQSFKNPNMVPEDTFVNTYMLYGDAYQIFLGNMESRCCTDRIGSCQYNIGTFFYKDTLYSVFIDASSCLENLVEIITLNNGNPIGHKRKEAKLKPKKQEEHDKAVGKGVSSFGLLTIDLQFKIEDFDIPKPYCLYEWNLKNKHIRIIHYVGCRYFIEDHYITEIYNDGFYSRILEDYKLIKANQTNKIETIKRRDALKF